MRYARVEVTDLSADATRAYLGDYSSDEASLVVHVTRDPDLKVSFGDKQERLRAVGVGADRLWLPEDGVELVFVRAGDGSVSGLTLNADRARGLSYTRRRSPNL